MFRQLSILLLLVLGIGCAEEHETPAIGDETVRLTFLHTSDIHGRLLPYRMEVTYTDSHLGLVQENQPFGGIARVAHIVNRERARAERVLYLDSGDVFQGAPIFNVFRGEAGFRAMSYLNPDAMVVGNHEFDTGLTNLIVQAKRWITFPFLAANYYFMPDNELGRIVKPYTIVNADGIKVALIGVGDFSSLSSLTDIGNSLKMLPYNNEEVIQDTVDSLRPLVDLVVLVSHAGLGNDQELIEATTGVDLVFGGHLHIVLNPPKVLKNKDGEEVILVHSGAFAKYVGRLDVVAKRDENGRLRIASHVYKLFPVDKNVKEDPKMAQLMEDYSLKLNQTIDLTSVYGYSAKLLTKYGTDGGDSALGNLVAEAIRRYARVDVGFTNTLGVRANMYPGPITLDDLYNIFPFDNSVTLMYMSGTDLREMLDYVARRSSGRGCVSQLQVAGIEFVMNCNANPPPYYMECHDCGHVDDDGTFVETNWEGCLQRCQKSCAPNDRACIANCTDVGFKECILSRSEKIEDSLCLAQCLPLGSQSFKFDAMRQCLMDCFPRAESISFTDCPDPMAVDDLDECNRWPMVEKQMYEVATNDYIAQGGSGFYMLKSNNTQNDTGLALRDAVQEVILTSDDCLRYCEDRDGDRRLSTCSVYQGCLEKVGEFYAGFCDKIDKTGGSEMTGELRGCAVDTAACYRESDCYFPEFDCADGSCKVCGSSAECLVDDPFSICVDGFCVERTFTCVNGRCVRVCETDDDCPGTISGTERLCNFGRCQPEPSKGCLTPNECVDPLKICYAADVLCTEDKDCGVDESCRSRMCVPNRSACSVNADCENGGRCHFGRCSLNTSACTADAECPDGRCIDGLCSLPCGNCSQDADCPTGLSCVKDLCVHLQADCVDYRCRTFCQEEGDCKSGEDCVAGLCLPTQCVTEPTGEELCRLNAAYKAEQKCVDVPCVDSRVDGRIGRILPDNVGDLEFGFVPNDPEDLDLY